MEVARVVRASGAAVVHANSVRAGALACAAAPLHGRPVIVHVRDCVTTAPLGQVVRRTVHFGAAAGLGAAGHFLTDGFVGFGFFGEFPDGEVFFAVTMQDAWVWDMYRPARFVKNVRVVTFKGVNVEELAQSDLELPDPH